MENIGIKHEFCSNNAKSCCHACLSTDRDLRPATQYADIYYKICNNHCMIPPNELYLCWECTALLKKLRMFTRKVAEAQRILQLYYTKKQDPFPNSLSNLTSHTTNNEIYFTHEETEIKEIKEEIDVYEDYDHFDADNIKDEEPFEATDTLPKIDIVETVPEPSKSGWKEFNMKRILNRKAKYRFLNAKLKKHRRLLIRKIPVERSEVLMGLEEERSDSVLREEFKCVYCVAAWNDGDGLAKHNEKYHDETIGPYRCDICNAHYPSSEKLLSHQTKHCYRRECKVCRLQSYSQNVMERHLAEHDRMVQCITCELCFKMCGEDDETMKHLLCECHLARQRMNDFGNGYPEPKEFKVLPLSSIIRFVERMESSLENVRVFYSHYKALHSSFVCDVCGKRCKARSIIEKHLRYHFGYECPYCKKKLKNSSSYKNHVETQHTSSVSDNSYCVQCDRRFTNDRMYKRHLQSSAAHAQERDNTRAKRKYPCPECSNVYSRRTYMNNHYRHVHSKQSKYYCEHCDRHFLNRTRYLDHRRFQHEGVKRDKDKLCNICGRGFAANRTLVNHIRTHSGERPFACEYCGAKFTQKHAMLSHVKYIHLKSKRASWHE